MTVEAEAGFEHGSGEHGSVPFGLTVAGGTPGPGIANEQEKRPSGFPEPGNSARLEDGVRPEGFYDDGGLYDVAEPPAKRLMTGAEKRREQRLKLLYVICLTAALAAFVLCCVAEASKYPQNKEQAFQLLCWCLEKGATCQNGAPATQINNPSATDTSNGQSTVGILVVACIILCAAFLVPLGTGHFFRCDGKRMCHVRESPAIAAATMLILGWPSFLAALVAVGMSISWQQRWIQGGCHRYITFGQTNPSDSVKPGQVAFRSPLLQSGFLAGMGFLGLCSCIFATVFGILVTIKQRRNTGDADDFTKRKSGDLELGRIDEAPEEQRMESRVGALSHRGTGFSGKGSGKGEPGMRTTSGLSKAHTGSSHLGAYLSHETDGRGEGGAGNGSVAASGRGWQGQGDAGGAPSSVWTSGAPAAGGLIGVSRGAAGGEQGARGVLGLHVVGDRDREGRGRAQGEASGVGRDAEPERGRGPVLGLTVVGDGPEAGAAGGSGAREGRQGAGGEAEGLPVSAMPVQRVVEASVGLGRPVITSWGSGVPELGTGLQSRGSGASGLSGGGSGARRVQ